MAFILSAIGDFTHASDILQRTNLRIWENAGKFREEGAFLPWAFTIARFEVLSFYRDRSRERSRVAFHPDVAELLMDTSNETLDVNQDREEALGRCFKRLSEGQVDMLRLRYFEDRSLAVIAEETGRSIQGVKNMLLRLREKLRDCIRIQLQQNDLDAM